VFASVPRLRVDVAEELGYEPALAYARLADDRHQLHRPLLRRALECPDQKRLLELPADERRPVLAADVTTEASMAALGRQSESGSTFPLTDTGWSCSYSKMWLVAR
jgi:hypothetical protein